MKEWFTKERITAWGQILLGCLLGAMAYPWFLVPNHIAPGGVTGLATVLNYLFGWPVGTASLLMNIPLFLIGYRSMGRTFAVRSLGATVIFSLLIDFLPLQPMTHDPLLGSLFGGVLLGVGLGFVLKGGATTGGTDMAARVIHQRIPYLSVGVILFICLYSSSKLIDVVMNGLTTEKACFINSLHGKEIKQALMDEIGRGVTMLDAKGGFSGQERPVVLCVVSAQELGRLKNIVHRMDPQAFVFISDAHEVLGEGFKPME